jgi:hypothetical protein
VCGSGGKGTGEAGSVIDERLSTSFFPRGFPSQGVGTSLGNEKQTIIILKLFGRGGRHTNVLQEKREVVR